MAKKNIELSERRTRAIKFADELGRELAFRYQDITQNYVAGKTLPELAELNLDRLEKLTLESGSLYKREEDLDKRVARVAIRNCLELTLSPEELKKIGRKHMKDTAYTRSMEGLTARGFIPYDNGKFIVIGNQVHSEIEYIDFLKKTGTNWDQIKLLVSSAFYPRTKSSVRAAYSRYKLKNGL
ncbi:MAG: hypothetical protein WC979_09710 [Candidatus Pacearchaeota archaeon]|jgi:hypothetical protein